MPRARLPLHIFEPRFLALMDDTLKSSHRLVGMIQPIEGGAGGSRLHEIGCAGRLTSFSETDDGRYMITLTGISRYRIRREVSGFTPYLRADVDWRGYERDLGNAEKDEAFERGRFLPVLARYLKAHDLSADWETLKEAEDELLINSLSMLCPFKCEDKQALLESGTLSQRRVTLETLVEFSVMGGEDEAMQ